jgi:hypothetical protein
MFERQVVARRIRRFPLRADILMPWQRFVEGNSLMAEILEDHIRHTLLIRNAVGIRQEEFMGDLISLMLTCDCAGRVSYTTAESKRDSPEPPRLSLKPSRLEGQLDALHVTVAMLHCDFRSMNI